MMPLINYIKTIAAKILKVLTHKNTIKYTISVLIIAFIMSGLASFLALIIGKLTLIDFLLTLSPQKRLTGANILAIGIDNTEYVQRSDTIMVFHLDPDKNRIGVISIPRDTRIKLPDNYIPTDPRIKIAENRMTKINHSYVYGGIDLLQETVSNLLNVPIDYYITINLDGVIKIIDQLGGININVEKNLYYTDKAGGLYIDLKRGPQTLSGKQAVAYLRFRHDNQGDIGRIHRQQVFIDALLKKILANNDFFTTPTLLLKLSSNIKTNLSAREIIGLVVQINNIFQFGNIETGSVPGAITTYDGLSYWRPDIIGLDKVVSNTLLGFEKQVTEETKVITQDTEASQEKRRALSSNEARRIQDTSETNATFEQAKKTLSIEVLNGNGEQGIAMRTSGFIKNNGFNVIKYGNAGSFNYSETRIVDWKGNVEHVIALASLFRIDPSKIIIYHKPEKKLDVTIVIGQDWAEIFAEKKI